MKLIDLVKHLRSHDCQMLREGSRHTVWNNPKVGKVSTIPRHKEINDFLAAKICKDLEIPKP